jgi:hypothetical protein
LLIFNRWYTAVRLGAYALAAVLGRGEAGGFAGQRGWWAGLRILLRAHFAALRGLPLMFRKRRKLRRARKLSDREFLALLRRFRISARELAFQAPPNKEVSSSKFQVPG